MPIADDLARLAPGTRVRLYHLTGGERRATSGTVVGNDGRSIRVRPLSGGQEVAVEVAAIDDLSLPERPRRVWLPPFSLWRIGVGAFLFGGLGYFVAMLAAFAGAAELAYPLWGGFILFGAAAGRLLPVGNPLHLAVLLNPMNAFLHPLLRLERRQRERWEAENGRR